jgi:hypothetical protein
LERPDRGIGDMDIEGGRDVMWGRTYSRRRRARDVRRVAERAEHARQEESGLIWKAKISI